MVGATIEIPRQRGVPAGFQFEDVVMIDDESAQDSAAEIEEGEAQADD